jgi:glycosyltransferase involved in cell wall biosynthesis
MATASRFPANTYILYVGARGGYKNFTNFLRAYSSSPSLRGTFGVVCFGGGEFCLSERKLLASLGLGEDKIVQLPGDDSVLAGLYSRAAVLVYPSLYEGFGIPPLEAMSFDCPVICSNTSSLPEVVGDAAELFDPSEPENIRIAIERVVMSAARTNALIALGRERIKNFSWDRCARETFTVYQRVLGIA